MKDFSAELTRASDHFHNSRFDQANGIVDRVLSEAPDTVDALNIKAGILLSRGDAAAAFPVLERAGRLAPDNSMIQFNFGRCCQMTGRGFLAIGAFEAAVRADPDNLAAWAMLAQVCQRHDRLHDCIRANEHILRLADGQPDGVRLSVDAHLGIGTARAKTGELPLAEVSLNAALDLSPDDPRIHTVLGDVYRMRREYSAAADHFMTAVGLQPESVMYRLNAATARMGEGDFERSYDLMRGCIADSPEDKRVISAYGALLWAMGRDDEYGQVFDHETYVSTRTADLPPVGYDSLDAFHRALIGEIRSDPSLAGERATKSTRGGLQTGNMMANPAPACTVLMGIIDERIARYIGSARRNCGVMGTQWVSAWTLVGWGVILSSQGYQSAHNHPSGMVSGVYYLQVPKGVGGVKGRSGRMPGCIEFGPPNEKFVIHRDPPRYAVVPQEGMMCLFPSHYWHHTIPFESPQERICIAFDAIPRRDRKQ